jgi:hypothetical protein
MKDIEGLFRSVFFIGYVIFVIVFTFLVVAGHRRYLKEAKKRNSVMPSTLAEDIGAAVRYLVAKITGRREE